LTIIHIREIEHRLFYHNIGRIADNRKTAYPERQARHQYEADDQSEFILIAA